MRLNQITTTAGATTAGFGGSSSKKDHYRDHDDSSDNKEWDDFRMDYNERYGRFPPDTLKEWLRFARYYNCNERDYYDTIEHDLSPYRNRQQQQQQNNNNDNQTSSLLLDYNDVIPSGLQQTDNYIAFRIHDNEIKTIASYNIHLNFVQQGEIESNILWILEPLKHHSPPLQNTIIFFDLHDHPTKNSSSTPGVSLPIFTTAKMSYITENQNHDDPIPTATTTADEQQQQSNQKHKNNKSNNKQWLYGSSPYHKDYQDSYDCKSCVLVPYYFGLYAADADPFMMPFQKRDDTIIWRGGTTGYDWGKSPRFQLMDLFMKQQQQQQQQQLPHPLPKGSNPIVDGVDADFAFVQIVQNYTSDYTMAPHWRMAPFMEAHESRMYKYIMDVDGNSFTSRFSTLLRSGSVVFKSTRFREWFSERLQPFVDYIPVNYDLSDLKEKISWIHSHPDIAERIVQHSKETSMNHIRDEDMRCYTYRLVLEYSTLFRQQTVPSRSWLDLWR